MRLVLDTNVTISGLLWRGTPHRLLQAIRNQQPQQQIYTSRALLEELTEVITRPVFSAQLQRIGTTTAALLADYIKIVEIAEPAEVPGISRDPDDDHVLACALPAKAELIVSGDKRHLLILGEYQGIPIRTASQALGQLTAPSTAAAVTPAGRPAS